MDPEEVVANELTKKEIDFLFEDFPEEDPVQSQRDENVQDEITFDLALKELESSSESSQEKGSQVADESSQEKPSQVADQSSQGQEKPSQVADQSSQEKPSQVADPGRSSQVPDESSQEKPSQAQSESEDSSEEDLSYYESGPEDKLNDLGIHT